MTTTYNPQIRPLSAEAAQVVLRPAQTVALRLDSDQWQPAEALGDKQIIAPAAPIRQMGDPTFCDDYGIDFPYIAGSMANGISSCELVEAAANAGMLGFYGAGGQPLKVTTKALQRLQQSLGDKPFGFNLIHSPNEPELESAVADLYIREKLRIIEASAYLDLTLPLVRYRLHGIYRDADGRIITPNQVIAKVSRIEVARKFFAPAPEAMIRELVNSGDLTEEQAELAAQVPVARDLTAEADSGGHTDNRPALALIPTMIALRDSMQQLYNYAEPLRVGAGGGIATPSAALAAFAMGAAYIVGGTVHQSCRESGTSDLVRKMLCEAEQADMIMAPAADMFEMGVKVQVLKRGTMFAMRASKLYDIYRSCASIEEIPSKDRTMLEQSVFQLPLDEVWRQTEAFFLEREPAEVQRAANDPKHRMALVFRWYLGQSPRWAIAGTPERRMDYQIWCGPGMGAFNEWVKGSQLEKPENRDFQTVALNLLYWAAVLQRVAVLRSQGADVSRIVARPLSIEEIRDYVEL